MRATRDLHPRGRLHSVGAGRVVAALVLLFLPAAFAQTSRPTEGEALVKEVIRAFGAIESVTRTLAIGVAIEVLEVDGEPLDPPGRATVSWKLRGGRALSEVAGVDLDGGLRAGRLDAGAHRARLCLPGGITETLDFRTGVLTRDQRTYVDASTLPSDAGAGEFWWTFCGTRRSEILARRIAGVSGVEEGAEGRVVELTADDSAGRQRIVFACREAWGFLASRCRMLVRHGEAWIELRRIEIHGVRRTRLGFAPADASLEARRPPRDGAATPDRFARFRARYSFGEPEYAVVSVPESLDGIGRESRPAAPPDAIASPFDGEKAGGLASALVREPIAGRGRDLDAFVAALDPVKCRGADTEGSRRAAWRVAWTAAVLAFTAGVSGVVLARRGLVAAGGAGCVAALIALLARGVVDGRAGPPDAHRAIARMESLPALVPPRSKTLCGVDCLYAAARLAGVRAPEYGSLMRLVRPGTHGTTLECLRIVAECLGLSPRVVNPRGFGTPPRVLLAHVGPRHFVVVTPLDGGTVGILDPGAGAFRARWEEVREILSPVALALRAEPRS